MINLHGSTHNMKALSALTITYISTSMIWYLIVVSIYTSDAYLHNSPSSNKVSPHLYHVEVHIWTLWRPFLVGNLNRGSCVIMCFISLIADVWVSFHFHCSLWSKLCTWGISIDAFFKNGSSYNWYIWEKMAILVLNSQ